MDAITSILCAVDSSPLAPRVLRHAVGVAGAFGARLTVLRATSGDSRGAEAQVRQQLAEAVPAAVAYPGDISVRVVRLAMGQPVDVILGATREDVDLLVAGTGSKSELSRWVLGSTTRALMREVTCSTLFVSPGQAEIVRLDRDQLVFDPGAVLTAIDLEEHNHAQLALAGACAARSGRPLVAMTVLPAGSDVAAAERVLATRLAAIEGAPAGAVVVRQGGVADGIDGAALDHKASLVVMGLSERRERGALADAVLATRNVLVLLVPPATTW